MAKIKRDAFLYLDGNRPDFAQCGSCWMYNFKSSRCVIMSMFVGADDSCSMYMKGVYPPNGLQNPPQFDRAEIGYVRRQVRCENCIYFHADKSGCNLYYMLNEKFPGDFDLDTKVMPRGCCNAQTRKD